MKRAVPVLTGLLVVVLLALFAWYTSQPSGLAGGSERDHRSIGEVDLEKLYPGTVLRRAKKPGKIVCLTFDDGPDTVYTTAVLDILKEKEVKATFFVIGKRVEENPEVAKRIAAEGHLLGNHTYSHPQLDKESPAVEQEISKTEAALRKIGQSGNGLFRPAYGAANPSLVVQVANLGYKVAMWSVDSLDWRGLSASEVRRNVENYVFPGAVVLFHCAAGPGEDLSGSVSALPAIIDDLKAQGYTFVTMSEMFDLTKPDD